MLSLLKKKSEGDPASTMPAWHPNLRNFEQLPDTKVVRTAFFINGAAVFLALALLLWFAYQEYQLHNLHRQITDWQRQIALDQKDSDQAIALYKKFQTEAARVKEIETFIKSKPVVSELLLHFGQTLPKNIALDVFETRDNGVTIRATVRGAKDQASGLASAYLDQLRSDPVLAKQFDDITLTSLNPSPQTGRLAAEFFLKFKGARKS